MRLSDDWGAFHEGSVPPNADPSLPVLLRYHRELDTAGREKLLRTREEVLDGLDDDRYDSDARLTDENRQSLRMVREHVWVERLRGQLNKLRAYQSRDPVHAVAMARRLYWRVLAHLGRERLASSLRADRYVAGQRRILHLGKAFCSFLSPSSLTWVAER